MMNDKHSACSDREASAASGGKCVLCFQISQRRDCRTGQIRAFLYKHSMFGMTCSTCCGAKFVSDSILNSMSV